MWATYILRCRDGRLYTGATNNISARLSAHNNGTGGAFTRAMRPCVLVWHAHCPTRSDAQKEEARIKRLSRLQKDTLIAEGGCKGCAPQNDTNPSPAL